MRTALEIVFWLAAGMIVWTQLGYALALAVLARQFGRAPAPAPAQGEPLPTVSLIVAAHDEQEIDRREGRERARARVSARAAGGDRRVRRVHGRHGRERAREAGADLVLELPRGGKVRAQDARRGAGAGGDRRVLRRQLDVGARGRCGRWWGPSRTRAWGMRAGRCAFFATQTKRPGARRRPPTRRGCTGAMRWRCAGGSRGSLRSPRATARSTPRGARRTWSSTRSWATTCRSRTRWSSGGWRAVYVPQARASERRCPSIEGERARKRRMMSHTWPIVLRGGMLSPRWHPPGYALLDGPLPPRAALRDAVPARDCAGRQRRARRERWRGLRSTRSRSDCSSRCSPPPGLGGVVRVRVLLVCRYYVLTTGSLAFGLWDWLRHGTDATWEAAEGTRPDSAAVLGR